MPITLLDGILLVIMFLSAILAMIRGFVREVLSIASWIAAAVTAYYFYKPVTPFLADYISNGTVATVVAIGVVFLLTLFIVSYITMRISDFVLDSRIGALDRTLGFVFGAARGFLIVVVAMLFFNWFVPEQQQPQWVMNAKSRHLLVTTGASLVAVLPEDPEQAIMDQIRKSAPEAGTNSAAEAEEPTYSSSERRSLDQLSETGTSRN
ncbi:MULTISPECIES: CvpA family protein [Pseudovibrio]|uniref:CvpA family protein n=1 Tax=Stappiaceae TaxID=2821832 RepID=UPI0023657C4B|nr:MULTISPECIES: CvpA family protein [Pseudovibrio]MDD7908921.1 CvpA family protein [Pseudovibrio exalbescens]MDX5593758.1 CvpA family protein [Pseudovibrio sp. SPO723]